MGMIRVETILYIHLFDAKTDAEEQMVLVAVSSVVSNNPGIHLAEFHLINDILHHRDVLLVVGGFYVLSCLMIPFQSRIKQIDMT